MSELLEHLSPSMRERLLQHLQQSADKKPASPPPLPRAAPPPLPVHWGPPHDPNAHHVPSLQQQRCAPRPQRPPTSSLVEDLESLEASSSSNISCPSVQHQQYAPSAAATAGAQRNGSATSWSSSGGGFSALRESPLLSAAEMQALLPAVAPEARRYLRELQAGTRGVAQQQRALRELASFSVKAEAARVHADKERTRLARLSGSISARLSASFSETSTQDRVIHTS